MSRAARNGWLGYGLALLVVVLDQLAKASILGGGDLAAGGTRDLWGPFSLTLVWNPGVAYGLFRSDAQWPRWALSGFELIVTVALAVWVRRSERRWTALSIGLVMGGAIGNLIDRVRFGAVVDFIDVRRLPLPFGWHFPWIFNIADSAITVGIIALLTESFFPPANASDEGLADTRGMLYSGRLRWWARLFRKEH
jgi:signal peptidase II